MITHTPTDGCITARLRREGSATVIEVADSGRGVPADQLPLIWDRVYRVDASRDRTTGGMGLGLARTRRVVEGIGGAINATRWPGVGTTITLRLASGGDAGRVSGATLRKPRTSAAVASEECVLYRERPVGSLTARGVSRRRSAGEPLQIPHHHPTAESP